MSSSGAYVGTTALGTTGFDRNLNAGNNNALSMFTSREITVTTSTTFEVGDPLCKFND